MNTKKALKQLKILAKKSSKMRLAAQSWNSDFKILISTILSARTRDEVTIPIAEKLFKFFPSAKKLSKAGSGSIEKIIKPINYYRTKSKNIIACAKKIEHDFKGKVPHDIDPLVSLPGVGRKTANVFLAEIGKDGIGVDTHVSYISQKLGWTKNKNPHKIEKDLKKLFPKKIWNKVNETLVRFGKTHTSRIEKDKLLGEIKRIR
jgi:endonuclease III